MPTTVIKYEDFLPKKVCHCPSLKNAVDEIFENDIRSYSDIILAVTEYCQGNSDLYFLRVQGKTNFFFFCHGHMIIKLLTEAWLYFSRWKRSSFWCFTKTLL